MRLFKAMWHFAILYRHTLHPTLFDDIKIYKEIDTSESELIQYLFDAADSSP
jgi:hypothetical protein